MKVKQHQLEEWLNHPVTQAYFATLAHYNNDIAEYVASGKCLSTDPLVTTTELYRESLGKMHSIHECINAQALMLAYETLETKEEESDE